MIPELIGVPSTGKRPPRHRRWLAISHDGMALGNASLPAALGYLFERMMHGWGWGKLERYGR